MAAGGCMDSLNKGRRTDDLHDHASTITLLDMMRPDRILQYDNFDLSASAAAAMRNEAGLAKCLERLAKSASVNKNTSAAVNTGRRSEPQKGPEFVGERRNHRYDRAASTDSVATSSGESCRSSSDSASSAPCSPESVLSDSGGAEGLPDSALASSGDRRRGEDDDEEEDEDDDNRRSHHHRLRDDATTIGGGSPAPTTSDPCFALSRLLLLQQHCGGRDALPASPSDLRKRDRRLVDEVVAAATSSRGSSRGSRSSADHHQQQQQQQQVCATAVVPTLAKDGRSEEAAGAEQEEAEKRQDGETQPPQDTVVESVVRRCVNWVASRLDLQQHTHHQNNHHQRHQQQHQGPQASVAASSPVPKDNAIPCPAAATTPSSSSSPSSSVSKCVVTSSVTSTSSVLSSSVSLVTCPSPSATPTSSSSLRNSAVSSSVHSCRWLDCDTHLRSEEELGDHVRHAHVDMQARDQGFYMCRWQGCKVFERRSCSRQWLDRHVTLCHGGAKPFACIVAGCGQRFASQGALERHVNAHFERSLSGAGPSCGSGASALSGASGAVGGLGRTAGLGKEALNGDSPLKLLRLRKKLKCRRRASTTAKHADFFDACVMEQLRHQLTEITPPESFSDAHCLDGTSVTFHGTVVARRKGNEGKVNLLMHWEPEHVLPDSWVPESSHASEKVVALSSLSTEALRSLNLWPRSVPCQTSSRRRKRK